MAFLVYAADEAGERDEYTSSVIRRPYILGHPALQRAKASRHLPRNE